MGGGIGVSPHTCMHTHVYMLDIHDNFMQMAAQIGFGGSQDYL